MPSTFLRKRKARETKLVRKFGTASPAERHLPTYSGNLLLIILLVVVVFLMSGGIYVVTSNAPLMIQWGKSALFYIPYDTNSQTVFEGISFSTFLVLGILGGFLASRTMYSSSRKESYLLILLSMVLILIGAFGSILLLELKIPGIFRLT